MHNFLDDRDQVIENDVNEDEESYKEERDIERYESYREWLNDN